MAFKHLFLPFLLRAFALLVAVRNKTGFLFLQLLCQLCQLPKGTPPHSFEVFSWCFPVGSCYLAQICKIFVCSVASTSQSNNMRALSNTSSFSASVVSSHSSSWANLILSPSPFTFSLNKHTYWVEFHLPVQISQQNVKFQFLFTFSMSSYFNFHLFKPWNGQSQFHIHGLYMDLQAGSGTSSLSKNVEVEQVFRQVLMIKVSSCMLHFFPIKDAKLILFVL